MEEELVHQDNLIQHVTQSPEIPNIGGFPAMPFPVSVGSVVFPLQIENPSENLTYGNADRVNPWCFCAQFRFFLCLIHHQQERMLAQVRN